MKKTSIWALLALVLVVIGAINWALFAFGFNLVDMILGVGSLLGKIVYVLVGISGIYFLYEKLTE